MQLQLRFWVIATVVLGFKIGRAQVHHRGGNKANAHLLNLAFAPQRSQIIHLVCRADGSSFQMRTEWTVFAPSERENSTALPARLFSAHTYVIQMTATISESKVWVEHIPDLDYYVPSRCVFFDHHLFGTKRDNSAQTRLVHRERAASHRRS